MTENMPIGWDASPVCLTRDEIYGLLELRDGTGDLLGFYDSVQDETRDGSGVLFGNGNLLQFLLSSRSGGTA